MMETWGATDATSHDGATSVDSGSGVDVDALAQGDVAAVDAFYRKLFQPVYAFVFWRVGGVKQDAEDVTQETFLTALRTIAAYERRASLQTWVCGIAKNLARERQRGRDRDARQAGSDDLRESLAALATAPLADGVLAREETLALVGRALSLLPAHYQRALVDKYVHGHSFVDMARAQDRSPKAVESTVQRAKAALVEALRRLSQATGDEP